MNLNKNININNEDNFIKTNTKFETNEIFYPRNNTKTAPINPNIHRQNYVNSSILNQNSEKNFIPNNTNGNFYIFIYFLGFDLTDINNSKYFMGNTKQNSQSQQEANLNIQKLKQINKTNKKVNIADREINRDRDRGGINMNINNYDKNDLKTKKLSGGRRSSDSSKEEEENIENKSNINNNQNILNKMNKNFYVKEYNEDNLLSSNYIKGENLNKSLTNKVWPKSRTFLSIISKMFNDNYIDENQRGLLKEMIMDQNQYLDNILDEYEIDADSNKLYENIIALADSYEKKMS